MLDQMAAIANIGRSDHRRPNPSTELFSPGALVRVAARLRRLQLDRALADGADPRGSRLLAARASQLARRSARDRIAAALEHAALTVDDPAGRLATPPLRAAVRANRAQLMDLAALLRHGGLVYARGIAILELVLIDGTGPAYTDRRGEGLARQLQLAAEGLSG
jgi:hypothetical protein